MVSKQTLIDFLERRVLTLNENHPDADETIKRKTRATRMRLNEQVSAEKIEQYFWSAMATDAGIDSYTKISAIGSVTFEDVRAEFKRLCGHREDRAPAVKVRQGGTGTAVCTEKLDGCEAPSPQDAISSFYLGESNFPVAVCPSCFRKKKESGDWYEEPDIR